MWQRLIILGLTYVAGVGCQRVEVLDQESTELDRLEEKHAAWARKQPRPPLRIVDRMEELLQQGPCVGRLDRWSRSFAYNYDIPRKTLYPKIVDFHFEEAGKFGVQRGRHITEPNSWVNIDDRPIKMVWGDYDVKEDRIRIAFCGNNVGGPEQGGINNMETYFDELKRRRSAHAS